VTRIADRKTSIDYYQEKFSSDGLSDALSLYAWILKLLNPKPTETLLDVSCGEGWLNHFAERYTRLSCGVDWARAALDRASYNAPQSHFVLSDAERLPFPSNSFDFVVNLGSLEHYVDPVTGAREMARVLRKSGKACILVPNSYFILDIIFEVWLHGRGPTHNQPLERFGTRCEWQNLLEASGFHVRQVLKYNARWPLSGQDFRWYLRHRKRLLSLCCAPFIPLNLSYSFVFLCSKV